MEQQCQVAEVSRAGFYRYLQQNVPALNDPVTIFAMLILLAAMFLLVCYLPAKRAMQVNPVTAIREFQAM